MFDATGDKLLGVFALCWLLTPPTLTARDAMVLRRTTYSFRMLPAEEAAAMLAARRRPSRCSAS